MNRDDAASMTGQLKGRLVDSITDDADVSRRAVLGGLALAGGSAITGIGAAQSDDEHENGHGNHMDMEMEMAFGTSGEYSSDQFDPHGFLQEFNTGDSTNTRAAIGGRTDTLNAGVYEENGQTVREFNLTAVPIAQEIAPGVTFPMWSYNGQVPAPTLRVEEGDLVRVNFTNGFAHMGHTVHPHLRNLNPRMDGVPTNGPGEIGPGESFTYEWQAQPMGTHLYHCHAMPLLAHIHRGMYGTIIVDPKPENVRQNPRKYLNYHGPITDEVREMAVRRAKSRNMISHADFVPDGFDGINEIVIVMNNFDTNFDGENEVYAANTRAFVYTPMAANSNNSDGKDDETVHPIRIDKNELQRVHLVCAVEFDFVNSMHTHSQFFDFYDHGTTLFPTLQTVDTVLLCQAQRGLLELDYSNHQPGLFMFHAHQSEFAQLGWMSFFEVTE